MKKNIINIFIGLSALTLVSSCHKQLDLAPISSISDANYWKTADQFDAFVTGIHANFRTHNNSFIFLGEMRADVFGTDPGNSGAFTGEATQGIERAWQNTLNLDNAVVTNYGASNGSTNFYYNINQINLLISKIKSTNIITTVNKNYYLGIAYGMRAFYYYHLLRSWGGVIIQTDPVLSFDIANLAKANSTAAEVMTQIKFDIDNSLSSYGSDYSFRNTKSYWSRAATLMLKADVYLWSSYRGGGSADASVALTALNEIQTNIPALSLQASYANVFATTNRGNSEIIFAIRNQLNEATMGFATASFLPQTGLISNFYDSVNNQKFNSSTTGNWGGLLRAPVRIAAFRKFSLQDSRTLLSIQPAYNLTGGKYVIAGCFTNKYQGEFNAGNRTISNDFPIYRYADLLLMKAEAEIALGQSPAVEMNLIRARAYGSNYSASLAYPNQAIDVSPQQALLQERLFEFVFEGKRWYDLLRLDPSGKYVYEQVLPASAFPNTDPAGRLLWPIDRSSLTNNRLLVQTAGYAGF